MSSATSPDDLHPTGPAAAPACLTRTKSYPAAAIIAAVVGLSCGVGEARVTVHNGLARGIVVEVGDQRFTLPALGHGSVRVPADGALHLTAATREGSAIEVFDVELHGEFSSYVYNVGGAAPLFEWTAVYGSADAPPPQRTLGAPRWSTTEADHVLEDPYESVSSWGSKRRSVLASAADQHPSLQLKAVSTPEERRQLIALHARWDPLDSRYILTWMGLALQEEAGFAELVTARLRESPEAPLLLRFEQDIAGAQKDAVCTRHREAAERTPDDGDRRHLAARCLPEGAEQDQAFLAAYRDFPENGWAAMAAGYTLAGRDDYAGAARAFDRARKAARPLRVQLADDTARLRRLAAAGTPVQLDDLLDDADPSLRFLVAIESEFELVDADLAPLQTLARGEVEKAAAEIRSRGGPAARMFLLLAAASDGASPALATDPELLAVREEDGVVELLSGYALAARAGRDTAAHVGALVQRLGPRAEGVVDFLEAVRSGNKSAAPPEDVGMQLWSLALSSAVALLGPEAPAEWRQRAKRGAWVGERPYFR